MDQISQMITQQLTGSALRQIAARVGVSESTADTAVQLAVPLILAGLARNATKPEGAEALHQAVATDHDGSILKNLMSYLGNPEAANGSGILGHALGGQRPEAENSLAQAAGVDQGTAGSLMELVAPLVMGAVGRTQQAKNLDSNGLAQYLGEQQAATPGLKGQLGSMLDSNKDGNVSDDLERIAGKLFK